MFDKHFDFASREKDIYRQWEESGVFKLGEVADGQPVFNITMPPPNANGELHIGHCYGHTVMDILGRYHRQKGEAVLLVPGKDHAGIQTQVVYERKLRAEGVEVEKMSREEFWKSCYDFCIDRSAYMRDQEKLMGISADFESEKFTLDPKVSEIVLDTFVKMYKDGLVYRGSRIVNWSIYSQTSISDVEVEYKEEKGHLWHLKYSLVKHAHKPERKRMAIDDFKMIHSAGNHQVIIVDADQIENRANWKIGEVLIKVNQVDGVDIERDYVIFGLKKYQPGAFKTEEIEKYGDNVRAAILAAKGEILVVDLVPDLDQDNCVVVATTRPETMLGDTAVAVNPADPRYSHLIGAMVRVPVVNREVAIIADDRIDIGFGTGAVKITPAHDFLDYQIGLDHQLEQIQVIDKFGKMTTEAGDYKGMTLLECREKLVSDLKHAKHLLLVEEINHKVPISERGKDVVEPLISTQWFLAVDKEGNSLKKRALDLVRSGRIKVFPARLLAQIEQWLENLNDWNISRQILWGHRMPVWYKHKDTEKEEIYVGLATPDGHGWEQETDTFDTWFSSGQWPYSTLAALGHLDLNDETKSKHFPTHTMVMGRDILLFWACRMLLFSAYRFNDIPWQNIFFTGLVRDSKGQKMSKSKNNGIEPKEILAKYGADAVRVGLIAGSTPGQDIKFDEKKIDAYAKYLNKIWNAAKLVAFKVEGDYQFKVPAYNDLKMDSSKWLLEKLAETEKAYQAKMDNYELSAAMEIIYHFSWDIYCSWYLEIAKIQLETSSEFTEEIKAVMLQGFEAILLMLHPFMPFFTEEIHENMERFKDEKLLAQKILKPVELGDADLVKKGCADLEKLLETVSACREVRRVLGKAFADKLTVNIEGKMEEQNYLVLAKMANAELGDLSSAIVLPRPNGIVKIAAITEEKAKFKDNLVVTLAKKEQEFMTLEKILTPGFKAKADPDLIAEREAQFAAVSSDVAALKKDLMVN